MGLLIFIGIAVIAYGVRQSLVLGKFEGVIKKILKDSELSVEEKMDDIATHMTQDNFMVQSRTKRQLQMFKKKEFNFIGALICLLCWIWPLVIYVFYYIAKRDTIRTFNFKGVKKAVA